MRFLKKIEIRNFKCFRDWVTIDLGEATYLAGANNSGKTAILAAVASFFDTGQFHPEFINKTELTGRKEGFNRSDIRITFDLNLVTGRVRKERMLKRYGGNLAITKSFTWREASETLDVRFRFDPEDQSILAKSINPQPRFDDLDGDVRHLLQSVAVSYIHPQEGIELLRRAQEKFKQRLFHNWGRHASVAGRVNDVQEKWAALRGTANTYLSSALSTKLKEIWPGAEVKVDLPERIQDIVAVSDITFRSSPNLPQVTLPSHGTGAQSAILYQTHYLLDSDRTLHQGMYFPIWLLEEPESFLHADIALQLSRLLSSAEWLNSIQMLISTHSPIILAGSRQEQQRCSWVILENHSIRWRSDVSDVSEKHVEKVGRLMGDPNFSVYFDASSRSPRIFLEDSRGRTRGKFEACGIEVTECLGGISKVKKYLEVLVALGDTLSGESYFVVDSDDGVSDLGRLLTDATEVAEHGGWKKMRMAKGVFVVLLPNTLAVEGLFREWQSILDESMNEIYDSTLSLRRSIPTSLSRAVSELRRKQPQSRGEAQMILSRHKDIKDRFWLRSEKWNFDREHIEAVRALLPVKMLNEQSGGE